MKIKLFGGREKRQEETKQEETKQELPEELLEEGEKGLPLPDFFVGMRMEVMTLNNRLIFVGKVERIGPGEIQVSEEGGDKLPYIEYNETVKLRGFVSSKIVTLTGMIGGSTEAFWKIDRMRTLQIEERRQFFRQSTNLSGKVMCVNEIFGRTGETAVGGEPSDCRVVDISAGGVMILCQTPFLEGDYLFLSGVEIVEKEKPFSFTCRIRRRTDGRNGFEYGCEFCGLDEKEHDRLVRGILVLQSRELRARRGQREER